MQQIWLRMIGYFGGGRQNLVIALTLSAAVLAFGTGPALAQDPARIDLKKFYQQNCARCHGPDGSAVSSDGKKLRGQDLTNPNFQRNTSDEKMVDIILNGKFFGLAMPKFKKALTEEEARMMVTDIIRNSKKGQAIDPSLN